MFDRDTINSLATIGKTLAGFIKQLKADGTDTAPMLDQMSEQVRQLQTHILSVQSTAFNLQSENSRLTDHVAKLKAELAKMEDWSAEKEKYKMKAIGGTMVYALKPDFVNSEPPHWICSFCYDNNQKSVLVPEPKLGPRGRGPDSWSCPRCTSKFSIPMGAQPKASDGT